MNTEAIRFSSQIKEELKFREDADHNNNGYAALEKKMPSQAPEKCPHWETEQKKKKHLDAMKDAERNVTKETG
jgi:hypothetical protein